MLSCATRAYPVVPHPCRISRARVPLHAAEAEAGPGREEGSIVPAIIKRFAVSPRPSSTKPASRPATASPALRDQVNRACRP